MKENEEERLVRLEEIAAFQERDQERLGQDIQALRENVERLDKSVDEVKTALATLYAWLDGAQAGSPPHELPPHYEPKKW